MDNNYLDFFTDTVLMVRPANFGSNPETAASNAFQQSDEGLDRLSIQKTAVGEFDQMVAMLRDAGIHVMVQQDSAEPPKTDAVFPNNWFSTHRDGTLVTYPMLSPNRRLERSETIIEALTTRYRVDLHLRMELLEQQGKILEGTGSMILDRAAKIAYACLSPRTDLVALEQFCAKMGYRSCAFYSVDEQGLDIYHTNVMMAMGHDFALLCLDSIKSAEEKIKLEQTLANSGKTILPISYAQLNSFAGNMLLLKNQSGELVLAGSEQAFQSLEPNQLLFLESRCQLLPLPIYTIEKYGGGSARCMLAEVFFKKKPEGEQ